MIMKDVRPLDEDLRALGFSEATPGGEAAAAGMLRLMGVEPVVAAAPGAVTESAEPGAVDEGADPFEGPVLSEELLERMEALDLEAVDLDALEELIEAIGDKEVPEALEARLSAVLDEMKKVRIQAGKVTRVNVRRGSKAMREKRKRRMQYKRKKAHIKMLTKKRSRKAGAKIKAAKTARKRKSLFGALKKIVRKAGSKLGGLVSKAKGKLGGGLSVSAKGESKLARELDALLAESASEDRTIRDELVVRLGECLELLDWILEEEEVAERFVAAYEPLVEAYCSGNLAEARVDDAEFQARVAPVARMIGRCVAELEGNVGSLA